MFVSFSLLCLTFNKLILIIVAFSTSLVSLYLLCSLSLCQLLGVCLPSLYSLLMVVVTSNVSTSSEVLMLFSCVCHFQNTLGVFIHNLKPSSLICMFLTSSSFYLFFFLFLHSNWCLLFSSAFYNDLVLDSTWKMCGHICML